MKIKFLHTIVCLLCASCLITSCLDSVDYDEIEYSPNSSITAFAIDDFSATYLDIIGYEKDSLRTDTIDGSLYPFAIDQKRRLIYNVDSLPVGSDLSKIVANITYDGYALYIVAGDKDSVWTSTDSLNFKMPIQFKAMSMTGLYGNTYTARINVHQQEPELLSWKNLGNTLPTGIRLLKAVELNNYVYVYALLDNKVVLTSTKLISGRTWNEFRTLDLPDNTDYASMMAWGKQLLMLAGNDLYQSTDAENWQKVETETKFSRLLANVHSNNNNKVYAINADNYFVESTDGIHWEVKEEVPASFPQSPSAFAISPLNTNSTIERITVMGNNTLSNDSAAIVWSRLTTESTWGDYVLPNGKQDYCPAMENIGLIYYNNSFYAFGGPSKNTDAFSNFYTSKDQCISWEPVKKWMFFPETFADLYAQADGNYSYLVDSNHFLWFIWGESGEVWKARINKMGFANYK